VYIASLLICFCDSLNLV